MDHRILMVAPRYLPLLGGIETHIDEVGQRMVAWGHRVDVLTTDPGVPGLTLPPRDSRNGMAVIRVPAHPKNHDYYFAPGIHGEITRRRGDYDLIHFQGYNTFVPIIGMLTAIRYRIPFVLTFHSGGHPSQFRNAIRGAQQRALAPLARRASQLIGVSEFEADLMATGMGIDRRQFTVIRNGASIPAPAPLVRSQPHLILSIGRLERYKGHHRAIEAMPYLRCAIPDSRLVIVGAGPYEAELRAMVSRLKVDEAVSFTSIPPIERERYSNLLHSAGLVVLFSEYEANPLAIMEALAAHRKVLVSYTSGLRELADAEWCRAISIVAPPNAVATAMAAELTTSRQQKTVFPTYTWDDCTRQLLAVYDAVLHRNLYDRKRASA